MDLLPQRRRLYHDVPPWVNDGAAFFITVCTRHRGINTLALSSVAPKLIESARHYHDRGVWWLRLIVIMPDHLHALLAVAPDRQLATAICAWKSYQTKKLRLAWQAGFFDHRLRNGESLDEKAAYIRMNPVRAGLVASPELWPYSWATEQPR